MAGNNFSKKICHELLLFEDYLHSCKNAPLQKDKIIVDKYKTLEIITELRSYHCADRDVKKNDTEAPEVTTFVKAGEVKAAQAEPVIKVKNKKEFDQAVIELNKELEKKREEAFAELAKEIEQKRKEEEARLLAKVKNAQKIADQALAKNNATTQQTSPAPQPSVPASPTLPMPEKNPKTVQSEEEVRRIISEAQVKADYMISQAETKAYMKQEEVDRLLNAKIAEAEKKAEEIIKNAHDEADSIISDSHQRSADLTAAGLKKAADLIEQAERIYKQQLEVIHTDREDILNILKQFDGQTEE